MSVISNRPLPDMRQAAVHVHRTLDMTAVDGATGEK
jgi:hypothetical protein